MSTFKENVKDLKKDFQEKKKKNKNYLYWILIIAIILQFTGIISDKIISRLWLVAGIISITIIIFDISTDMQHLDKRLDNIEEEISEIEHKKK